MHEMTLLPSGCVNDTLQSSHLEVCTNEKIKIKIKIAREVKLWEGMDNLVAFIETSHVECHLYKSSATTTTIFTTMNLQTDMLPNLKRQFIYSIEVVEIHQSHLLSHQFISFM